MELASVAVAMYALPPVQFQLPAIAPLRMEWQGFMGDVAEPRDRSSSPAPPPPRLA